MATQRWIGTLETQVGTGSSITKPITAVATMILVEDSKLQLEAPIDRWLPELSARRVLERPDAPLDRTVPAERSICVRDPLPFCFGFGQIMGSLDGCPIL
jgi:hypothetical protein